MPRLYFTYKHANRQSTHVHTVTCRLYTPLHYRRRGQGSSAVLHWSPRTAGSLYQAAGNGTYHNVTVVVTGKRSVLRVYSSSRCKIYWSQGRCRLSQMNILPYSVTWLPLYRGPGVTRMTCIACIAPSSRSTSSGSGYMLISRNKSVPVHSSQERLGC